ncbi:MAG: putative selenate ABC transporter substrate-binding protein, partial [Dehalococcoidia bacterium]
TTPAYFDYNWTVGSKLDEEYGDGFTGRLRAALLALNYQEHDKILELFSTQRMIESNNDNYRDIENVARSLGIIR